MTGQKRRISLQQLTPRVAKPEGETVTYAPAPAVTSPPGGRRQWRSLDEWADTPEFRDMVHREFPVAASEWDDSDGGVSRRNFLKVMAASLALAGLTTACARKVEEKIIPYVQQPEELVPGRPLFYASTFTHGGYGKGVLVEQHEGRPTKIEGNRDHPASLGATDVWMQASILDLYDPDRSQVLLRKREVASWGSFTTAFADVLRYNNADDLRRRTPRTAPARIRVLTDTVTSPTLAWEIGLLRQALPQGSFRWHAYDPVGRSNAHEGTRRAFGRPLTTVYDFTKAKVVVSLDGNFLLEDPGSLAYARQFIDGRRQPREKGKSLDADQMNRLYVAESTPTITGAMADERRRRVSPREVSFLAQHIHAAVTGGAGAGGSAGAAAAGGATTQPASTAPAATAPAAHAWLQRLVADLLKPENRGKSLVYVGEYQPPEVHRLGFEINAALGNIGDDKPVRFVEPVEATVATEQNGVGSLQELAADMRAGNVDVLLILGSNPAYTASADLNFGAVLEKFQGFSVHLGLYQDETAIACGWHIPESHYLEAWGDARAYDGTASIVQPLIAPLYPGTKSAIEVLATVFDIVSRHRPEGTQDGGGAAPATQPTNLPSAGWPGYEIVRQYWRNWTAERGGAGAAVDFDAFWYNALLKGVIDGTRAQTVQVNVTGGAGEAPATAPAAAGTGALTVVFRPDPCVWDGRYANNSWLQELPKPLTKLTWDNTVLMSPKTAVDQGLAATDRADIEEARYDQANGKLVNLALGDLKLERVPVWVQPGHPDDCVTLHLGYGRTSVGRVGSPQDQTVGFNVYRLRTTAAPWFAYGLTVTPAGGTYPLACTQKHQVIDVEANQRREIVRYGRSAAEVRHKVLLHNPAAHEMLPHLPDDPSRSPEGLYPEAPDHEGGHDPQYPAWGMVVDQTACIGCNACVVACQSENIIPVVGKGEVLRAREMHWLRIDTYYETSETGETGLVGKSAGHGHAGAAPHDDHPGDEKHPKAARFDDVITDPDTLFQPMLCQHCEKAPCEVVCPVAATSHSKEGLNEMTYNRCVGTRYCSNNCPYKVRRFNFLQYSDYRESSLMLMRNPEVTVRNRGVMEKCTYCVQRINRGRIEAKKAEVKVSESGGTRDAALRTFFDVLAEVETACQQACPTNAIIFGNMFDERTDVFKLKQSPINYGVLEELNTRPRTTYLARMVNPNRPRDDRNLPPLGPARDVTQGGGGMG